MPKPDSVLRTGEEKPKKPKNLLCTFKKMLKDFFKFDLTGNNVAHNVITLLKKMKGTL